MMTKNHELWDTANRLLSEVDYFESERSKVLDAQPLLNSQGLRYLPRSRRGVKVHTVEELKRLDDREIQEFEAARDALRTGGRDEQGIRNTLEYFVEGRIALSYRLRGCTQPKRFNGPAPPKTSSYRLKHRVESFLQEHDRRNGIVDEETKSSRFTSNGAFICASLMVGLKFWTYRGSIHPDFRIGQPWAVAGLQPDDYDESREEVMARFWRWMVQLDRDDPVLEEFIGDTIDLLYDGASLQQLRYAIVRMDERAQRMYQDLILEFRDGVSRSGNHDAKPLSRIGFLVGEIEVPDDFNEMGAEEISRLFEGNA